MSDKKSPDELRKMVIHALHLIAPEADLSSLDPDAPIRQELEIDSMDFLRLMQHLGRELKIDIPEKDYKQLSSVTGCVNYLNLA